MPEVLPQIEQTAWRRENAVWLLVTLFKSQYIPPGSAGSAAGGPYSEQA